LVAEEEKTVEQEQEAVQEEQEIIVQEKEAEAVEVKEAEAYSSLPNELEPESGEDIDDEDLMDEEESPKKKEASAKKKKKTEVKSELPVEANEAEFTMKEFKKDGKDPKGLMGSIRRNKPEISLTSSDPLEWLNELLSSGDNGQPLKYDIQVTEEIKEAREAFEAAAGAEKIQKLIKLNRLILEQAYPLKCPKLQTEEPRKNKRSKSTDNELNMN